MRVITGEARGRKLKAVEGLATRPTTERTKQSLFNAIQFDIEGRRVLDLFAGTGQLGIEALSRGAADCVFVDQASAAVTVIRENLHTVGFEKRAEVIQGEALGVLRRFPPDRFGLIFLDPPYEANLIAGALERIMRGRLLREGGLIVCETLKEEKLPAGTGGVETLKEYVYGKSRITLLTRRGELPNGGEVQA